MRGAGMMRRLAVLVVISAVTLSLAAGSLSAGATHGRPHAARPRVECGRDHVTQVPGAFERDDWWVVPECILVTPGRAGFTVTTSVRPRDAGVVAYLYSGYGWSWGAHDPGTRLPQRLRRAGWPKVTWDSPGDPPGVYNKAVDMWLSKGRAEHSQPEGAEIMVWISSRGYRRFSPVYRSPVVRIDGSWWHVDVWLTSAKEHRGASWPLVIFARDRSADSVRGLSVRPFADYAVSRGLVSGNDYLMSVLAGYEVQHGGKGLRTVRFSVTGTR